jgi:hypothetical protein
MRIDSAGNLGLGVTPSAWSVDACLEIEGGKAISFASNSGFINTNAYFNSGWKYIASSTAAQYQQDGGTHKFFTAPSGTAGNAISFTEAMRIDSAGNVGIGTSTPGANSALRIEKNNGYLSVSSNVGSGGTTNPSGTSGINFGWNRSNGDGESNIVWGKPSALAGYLQFAMWDGTTYSERMRIDSSGNLLVGVTTKLGLSAHEIRASVGGGGEAALAVYNSNTQDAAPALNAIKDSSTTSSSQRFIQFYAGAGGQSMGGIVGNGATNAQFLSLSDAREKENIKPVTGALARVCSVDVVSFDRKGSGEHVKAGFVAQNVLTVFPEYVVENASNVGEEPRLGITGGMSAGYIAELTAAIQEQQAIINDLKTRIEALEGTQP